MAGPVRGDGVAATDHSLVRDQVDGAVARERDMRGERVEERGLSGRGGVRCEQCEKHGRTNSDVDTPSPHHTHGPDNMRSRASVAVRQIDETALIGVSLTGSGTNGSGGY